MGCDPEEVEICFIDLKDLLFLEFLWIILRLFLLLRKNIVFLFLISSHLLHMLEAVGIIEILLFVLRNVLPYKNIKYGIGKLKLGFHLLEQSEQTQFKHL